MARDGTKRSYRTDMLLAGAMVVAGLAISGISAAELLTTPHQQMAQATQPLQSTPGAETKPSAPADPATRDGEVWVRTYPDAVVAVNPSDIAGSVSMGSAGQVTIPPRSAAIEAGGHLLTSG